MAAKTPVSAGTTGYVDTVRGLWTGARGSAEVIQTVGTLSNNRTRFRQLIYYFSDIDDGDTWTSGLPNIQACFWAGDTEAGDACNAVLTTAATGVITFETVSTSDISGYLLLFLDNDDTAHGFSQR